MTTGVLNTKIGEVENRIPNPSNLVTTIVLNTKIREIENKIPDDANYHEFNKITVENLAASLKQVNVVNKTHFDNKLTSFNK